VLPCGSVRPAAGLRDRPAVSHISRKTSQTANFLYAALDRTACAPFLKERRRNFRELTELHRKSGVWGTRRLVAGIESLRENWVLEGHGFSRAVNDTATAGFSR
jgi:hypothetical protein